jgi:5-methylcytosine-specific restriction endonuclease McrA
VSTRAERVIRLLVMDRDHWTCQICGAPATDAGHRVARHHGGAYTLDNLEAQCVQHNRGEGRSIAGSTAATPRDWTF